MVVANTPQSHPDLPGKSTLIFEDVAGGTREEDRVLDWEKIQELRSGKVTLWDHCFELPHKHLEATRRSRTRVTAGKVDAQAEGRRQRQARDLRLPRRLRPALRRRRQGRRRAAGRAPEDLQGQQADRRDPHAGGGVREPRSSAARATAGSSSRGHKFTLEAPLQRRRRPYVLTERRRIGRARPADFRGRQTGAFRYHNDVHVHPARRCRSGRPRVTPKPVVHGHADGRRRRPRGRGDLHRQVRPREGPVPLGPRGQERRRQLLLDPRRARPGPASSGASSTFPRIGQEVDRRLPRRRPGPADHRRQRLQRRHDAALRAAGQQDAERHQDAQHARRRPGELQRDRVSRTRRARSSSTCAPRRTMTSPSSTTRPTGSATTGTRPSTTTSG